MLLWFLYLDLNFNTLATYVTMLQTIKIIMLCCKLFVQMQGMVALEALSYLLQLDGQQSLADHYDQTNHNFINYFLGHGKVSSDLI